MRKARCHAVLGMVVVWLAGSSKISAQEDPIAYRVINTTSGEMILQIDQDKAIQVGDIGALIRDGVKIAEVEIIDVDRELGSARPITPLEDGSPVVGDRILFRIRSLAGEEKPKTGEEQEFVPLLAPPAKLELGYPEVANLFHGQIHLRQLFQVDSEDEDLDYSFTQIGTSGSIDRIGGTPWLFEWSANVSFRGGNAFRDNSDFDEPRFDLHRASFYRKFDGGAFLRLGRFLPRQLPGMGFIDGLQGELPLGKALSAGAVVGFKPDRRDLDFSDDEPTAAGYLTLELGAPRKLYYSGTFGVLISAFEEEEDRLAFLFDQRLDLSTKLSIYSSAEVDADIGAESRRDDDLRLTRIDLYAISQVTSHLTLRAGFDHYERPDIEAERDLVFFDDDRFFDRGFWRYWVGASQRLPLKLQLDGEISFIESPDENYSERWRLSLTRRGLPALPDGSLTLAVYNLDGAGAEGYGGNLFASLPLFDRRLFLRPRASFRHIETDENTEKFRITDLSLHADWRISRAWTLNASVAHSFGEDLDSTLFHIGVVFRW